jgi:hypothetical protein
MKLEKGEFILISFSNAFSLGLVESQKNLEHVRYYPIHERGLNIYKTKLGLSKGVAYQNSVSAYNQAAYPNNKIGDIVTTWYKPQIEYVNKLKTRVFKITEQQVRDYFTAEGYAKDLEALDEFVLLMQKYGI